MKYSVTTQSIITLVLKKEPLFARLRFHFITIILNVKQGIVRMTIVINKIVIQTQQTATFKKS